ncbi:MAG: fumarate hydratase [Bacillota bacterium]
MRLIHTETVTEAVARLCREVNRRLSDPVRRILARARDEENWPLARHVLETILENDQVARRSGRPLCQDTGTILVHIDLGQEVHLIGAPLAEVVDAGVRQAYEEGTLRASMVASPLWRENTGDNTPAFLTIDLIPGDRFSLSLMAKGGGSENMSSLAMLKPADGLAGVVRFVVETVERAGPNACPPVVVGVGVGGTLEVAARLAKKALFRSPGQPNGHPNLALLERELLEAVNDLGIGPQGLGGRTTVLWVAVESAPCHIASLPVAVNLNCHSIRIGRAEL